MKRCPHCGNPIGFPGVIFTAKQRKLFMTIYTANPPIKDYKELSKRMSMTYSNTRTSILRLRALLKKETKDVVILSRPLRVVKYSILAMPRNRQLPLDL